MQKATFMITKVLALISVLHLASPSGSTVYTDGYYLPLINYEHTIFFNQNISFEKFQANGQIMMAFTQTNQILAYDATSYNQIQNTITAQNSTAQNTTIEDIYYQSYEQSLYTIDELGKVTNFYLSTNQIYFTFSTNLTGKNKIYPTTFVIYVLQYSQLNQTSAVLYRYDRKNNFQLLERVQTNITGIINIQICQDPKFQIVLLWNSTMFIQTFNCTQNCTQISNMENDLNSDLYTSSIIFYGCASILIQYDDIKPITIYQLATFRAIRTIASDKKIMSISYLDDNNKNLAIFFANTSLVIHQLWGYLPFQNSYIYQYDNFTEFSQFSLIPYSNRIHLLLQDRIQSYSMVCQAQTYMFVSGLCSSCDIKCNVCDQLNGTCYLCKNPYKLDLGSCYEVTDTNEIYTDEEFISSIASKTLDTVCIITQKMLLIMQIAPIAWMFLNFINFWNICSLYLLINIAIPNYFTDYLTQIYNQINFSVLEQLGINFQINLPISQSVNNGKLLQYSVTSNFIDSNFQNFITICFVLILLLIVRIFQSSLDKKNWLYKQLKLDNFLIIVGQYIPLMSSLFLPVSSIYENMNFKSSLNKLNLIFNIMFIGLSLLLPFILFAYFQMIKSRQLNKKRQQRQKMDSKQKQITFQEYNWFFNSIINISISFLISFQTPKLFLIWNFFIFAFGIYISFKATNHKVNGIILSSHIFLFHLGFIGMYIFQNYSNFMYHHSSSFGLFFLLTGAVHQISTVFIESMIQIYKWIKRRTTKIKPQIINVSSHAFQKNNVQTNFTKANYCKRKQFQISILNTIVQEPQKQQTGNNEEIKNKIKKISYVFKKKQKSKKLKQSILQDQLVIKNTLQLNVRILDFIQNYEIEQAEFPKITALV